MDFNELSELYKLDFRGLGKILKKKGIALNLEHLNDIPKDWIPIIEDSLGLTPLVQDIGEIKPKQQLKSEELGQSSQNSLFETVQDVFHTDLTQVRTQKANNSKYPNVSAYSGRTKKSNHLNNKKSKRKSSKESKKCFYAYVKYVGPKNDHAFIRIYEDINLITYENANLRDDQSYKLAEDCSRIIGGQIILVDIRNENYKIASIVETSFIGSFVSGYQNTFVDWTSFDNPFLIENITFYQFEVEDLFVSIKLIYSSRKGIYCDNGDRKLYKETIGPIINQHFVSAISGKDAPHKTLITAFKNIIINRSFHDEAKTKFMADVDRKHFIESEDTLNEFIEKWSVIEPSLLSYNNMKDENSKLIYFDLWLNNKLPLEFWGEWLINVFVDYNLQKENFFEENNLKKIAVSFYDQSHHNIISAQVFNYFHENNSIDSLEIFKLLTNVVRLSNNTNKNELCSIIGEKLNPDLKFKLWLEGSSEGFIKSEALSNFSKYESPVQERILMELEDADLIGVLNEIKDISNPHLVEKINSIVENLIKSSFKAISFDIESDTNNIHELAYNVDNTWQHYESQQDVENALHEFKTLIEKPGGVLVGHNIIDFDCPIMEAKGISFEQKFLWDTYRIEMLLSPELQNFALITEHNAKYDAKITLDLFLNQIFRYLLNLSDSSKNLEKVLPEAVCTELKSLRQKVGLKWVQLDDVLKARDSFFRPQAKTNVVIVELKKLLVKSTKNKKLILGPDSLKNDVLGVDGISFITQDHLDLRELDEELVSKNSILKPWLKQILLNFIGFQKSTNAKAFWGNLSLAIKMSLEKHAVDIFTLVKPLVDFEWKNSNVIYITADELFEQQHDIQKHRDIDIFIIQPDLVSVTQKRLLKEFEIVDFQNFISHNHFWMKFSGGQSYVSLTKNDCEELKIDVPSGFTNFWIEKYQFGKYRVWGNYNWEDVLNRLSIENKYTLHVDSKKFNKEKATFVRVNFSKTANKNILRFNPESVYRSRYWVFQKELVEQILVPGKLGVLLIQRYDELEVLEAYFRNIGFYIPDRGASLARRFELLYESNKRTKIIIDVITNISKVLNANYLGDLNIIIDSFNLTENYYIAQNTSLIGDYQGANLLQKSNELEELSTDDDLENENIEYVHGRKPLVKDIYLLLTLHLPQINHYRNLLRTSSPNHQLWILDSRVNDFPNLSTIWHAKSKTLSIWSDPEQYERDVKEAEVHIKSPKPISELPFTLNEIKNILSQVFLKGKPWYSYQDPYLDVIIPGKTDELITLPTGGGKSLLFQGPALFKSAFTNKLTVVVTPLKALMEDQVSGLWEKGFYGAVEYLNSDRGTDVQMIYRAMAGGELSLIFVTPERFRSRSFLNALNVRMQSDDGLEYFVFDEAHCVSQWGHEFRPDYFNCAQKVKILKQLSANNTPLLLFSATVSKKIFEDFKTIFG